MPDSLTAGQTACLRAFAATVIPASPRFDMPGADDAPIFDDIVASIERDHVDVCKALARIDALAGGSFAALAGEERLAIANRWRAEGGPDFAALTRVVLLCYYRDDRVMRALGQEPRPPFPKGHEVEQGDWSLLDPVKQRKPFYRQPG